MVADADLLVPADDLVMIVDRTNTAHVLLPLAGRPIFRPTLCGVRMNDLAAIPHDVQEILAARWDLLTDRQYRAWPPWPCQSCLGAYGASLASDRDGRRDAPIGSHFGSDVAEADQ